ncbi:putative E3 ubiquitin-protein ligase RHG1A isoform B [Glycine soja]|uniref:Putative E3 ubiquitin-protein ligase RHG1A isoform B n=1 Tax=Glycine soja TaxID=3848 RepID=A0A445KTL1_GLYSO|nr:putative E3 ubiquitin-protein ligase RHG1A isoform B [Glycine soja]
MPTIAARQGRAHLTTPEEKGTPQIKIHYFKLINNHLKHIPYITPPSPILFSRVSLSLSETMPVTNTTTPTVAEHIKWRRPRNQFNHHHHHHHHPISETDPNPQIPSIIQSTRCKSTISSLLLSTFSNNTSNNATAHSKKKSNFSASTFRGLGCTAGSSQQVSVPAVIRSSADWQGKKTRKKKHKRSNRSSKNKTFHGGVLEGSNPGCVDFQDVWCGPGIGFSTDAAASVDCVVARKNVSSARGKIDVDKITHRERSSYVGRRTETFTFLDSTDPDIFTPRSASDTYGTATYYRHVRDPSSDGFAEVASNIHIPFSLSLSSLMLSARVVRLRMCFIAKIWCVLIK